MSILHRRRKEKLMPNETKATDFLKDYYENCVSTRKTFDIKAPTRFKS